MPAPEHKTDNMQELAERNSLDGGASLDTLESKEAADSALRPASGLRRRRRRRQRRRRADWNRDNGSPYAPNNSCIILVPISDLENQSTAPREWQTFDELPSLQALAQDRAAKLCTASVSGHGTTARNYEDGDSTNSRTFLLPKNKEVTKSQIAKDIAVTEAMRSGLGAATIAAVSRLEEDCIEQCDSPSKAYQTSRTYAAFDGSRPKAAEQPSGDANYEESTAVELDETTLCQIVDKERMLDDFKNYKIKSKTAGANKHQDMLSEERSINAYEDYNYESAALPRHTVIAGSPATAAARAAAGQLMPWLTQVPEVPEGAFFRCEAEQMNEDVAKFSKQLKAASEVQQLTPKADDLEYCMSVSERSSCRRRGASQKHHKSAEPASASTLTQEHVSPAPVAYERETASFSETNSNEGNEWRARWGSLSRTRTTADSCSAAISMRNSGHLTLQSSPPQRSPSASPQHPADPHEFESGELHSGSAPQAVNGQWQPFETSGRLPAGGRPLIANRMLHRLESLQKYTETENTTGSGCCRRREHKWTASRRTHDCFKLQEPSAETRINEDYGLCLSQDRRQSFCPPERRQTRLPNDEEDELPSPNSGVAWKSPPSDSALRSMRGKLKQRQQTRIRRYTQEQRDLIRLLKERAGAKQELCGSNSKPSQPCVRITSEDQEPQIKNTENDNVRRWCLHGLRHQQPLPLFERPHPCQPMGIMNNEMRHMDGPEVDGDRYTPDTYSNDKLNRPCQTASCPCGSSCTVRYMHDTLSGTCTSHNNSCTPRHAQICQNERQIHKGPPIHDVPQQHRPQVTFDDKSIHTNLLAPFCQ